MTWIRVNGDSGAVNLDRTAALGVRDQGGGVYVISVFTDGALETATPDSTLNGTYASLADAQTALVRITAAVDPADYS